MADKDAWFDEVMEAADAECPAEPLDAEHPLYVLYTSGSTAKPKGILHTTGGYLTQVAWTHQYVFDLKPDQDVYLCTADVGWVTGHSYIVYGPLANGATSVMYEGAPDYPHKGIWWELCERYGATLFYTAPTAIRACMKWGTEHVEKFDLSKLRLLGTVGEPINPKAWLWYREVVGGERCPVVDTWWQTETGGDHDHDAAGRPEHEARRRRHAAARASTRPSSTRRATRSTPARRACSRSAGRGRGCCARSSRTTTASSRPTSRSGTRRPTSSATPPSSDDDGYVWVIGRVDDVINVSGHRMSTAEVESAIVSHPKVAESAVIGQQDEDTGQSIAAFVTLEGERRGLSDELVERDPRARRRRGSASSRGPSASSGPTTCPRRARARSCAACCATSPRAASSATSRRCATPT